MNELMKAFNLLQIIRQHNMKNLMKQFRFMMN